MKKLLLYLIRKFFPEQVDLEAGMWDVYLVPFGLGWHLVADKGELYFERFPMSRRIYRLGRLELRIGGGTGAHLTRMPRWLYEAHRAERRRHRRQIRPRDNDQLELPF